MRNARWCGEDAHHFPSVDHSGPDIHELPLVKARQGGTKMFGEAGHVLVFHLLAFFELYNHLFGQGPNCIFCFHNLKFK